MKLREFVRRNRILESRMPVPFVELAVHRSRGFISVVAAATAALCAVTTAQAQQPSPLPAARIVVVGEGKISAAPDYAVIRSGVTSRAKTAAEAIDANSKAMTAVIAALTGSGIAQKDIQTARFSVQPVYAAPQPGAEQKLTGFSASNQVAVTVRDIGKVGDVLDRLIGAGATDVGNIEFLHADISKTLDQAREAAVADARRKAELYARAAGLSLGGVLWITEESASMPMPMPVAMRAGAAVPISPGEDVLSVRVTVGFDVAR
jgi:uncharacterized protein YggE